MIAFASLFLGLVLGPQTVEVAVGAEVARVELQLDGEPVAQLSRPVWTVRCDFGAELAPHELLAVAYDREGREVGRARQWINLPRPPAEVGIVIERGRPGRPAVAHLTWDSIFGEEPLAITATFDGRPVEVGGGRQVVLPPHDPGQLHLLRVEVDFTDTVGSVAEAVFGGTYADRVDSELTAVPVVLQQRGEEPAPEALGGVRGRGGVPLEVVAVERGTAEAVVVRDRGAVAPLRRIQRTLARHLRGLGGIRSALREAMPLDKDQRLRLLWPHPRLYGVAHRPRALFPTTASFSYRDAGVYWLLSRLMPEETGAARQQLADAVAVAGLSAAARKGRRAVVLVLGEHPEDHSQLSPAQVRRYLQRLQVPFFVWSAVPDPGPGARAWGEAVRVDGVAGFDRAVSALAQALDRQRILWVRGVHLPQEITLSPGTGRGLTLAAAEPPPPSSPAPRRPGDEPILGAPSAFEAQPAAALQAVAAGTRLRREPRADAAAVATVASAAELEILERRGSWVRLRYGAFKGWTRPGAAPGAEPGELDRLIAAASRRPAGAGRVARAEELLGGAGRRGSIGPFTLLTDLADRDLEERLDAAATSLVSAYRRRYGVDFGDLEGAWLVVFRRSADYQALSADEPSLHGLGAPGHAAAGLAALTAEGIGPAAALRLAVHELAHLLNRRSFARELPAWLEEGIAEDLAYSRFDDGGRLVPGTLGGEGPARPLLEWVGPGRLARRRELTLAGGRAALVRLLAAWDDPRRSDLEELVELSWAELVDPRARQILYPESAFFVRFLLDGGDRSLAEGFRSYLSAVAAGSAAGGEALAGHLGAAPGDLQDAFHAWLLEQRRAVLAAARRP